MNFNHNICNFIKVTSLVSLVVFGFANQSLAYQEQTTAQPKRALFQQFQVGQKNVKTIMAEDDYVWIGSSAGLIIYNVANDSYDFYNNRNGLRANGVFSIDRISEDKVAVGSYGGGLAIFEHNSKNWTLYNVPEGLGDPFVYDVLRTANGDVWIATWTGVNRVVGGNLDDPKAWELHTVKSTNGGLPNDWVYGLSEGKDGIVWLATEGGLARYENGQWHNWNHEDGLGATYDLIKQSTSSGRDPADYSRHHAKQKKEQGLTGVNTAYNPNYVVSLAVDPVDGVWTGTWGAGLSFFDGKNFTTLTELDGLPSNHVYMLKRLGDYLWIGTSKGLVKYHPQEKTMQRFTKAHGLFADSVFSMDVQNNGSFWVGSFGGVSRIDSFPDSNP